MSEPTSEGGAPSRRDETSVISYLRSVYGIPEGSRFDPILNKLAKGDILADEEREVLEYLEKPRPKTTTKLNPESLNKPREIQEDITAQVDAAREKIRTATPQAADIPAFLKKSKPDAAAPGRKNVWSRIMDFLQGK